MKKLLYLFLLVPLTLFGQDNYSLSFDGDDDYVTTNSAPIPASGNFTISLIALCDTIISNTYAEIISQGQSSNSLFYIGYNNLGNIRVSDDWQNTSTPFPNDNLFHNYTVVKSTSNTKLYIDGILVESKGSAINNPGNENPFIIGAATLGYSNIIGEYFSGNISSLLILNTDINDEQVQSIFSCISDIDEETIISYWDFNENSGDTVYDISGNGNHGVINGATYSGDTPEQNCDDSSLNELSIIDQLNQSFNAWNVSIDLSAGWNMFGYGCPSSIDVADGLSNHTESIIISKDNNGNVYMAEFGFNGIGDFTPGFGYQIKLTEAIEGFSLCDWYVNDIPEDNIISLQEENTSLQAFVDSVNASGCTDSLACNYRAFNLYDDGSCEYPTQGYDCDGNINIQIGDEAFGGIVFYVDSTGQHGLVAALEDLGDNNPWGCSNLQIQGADETLIGGGYQNTLDIIAGCSETPIAASKALAYESDGYDDWYLPSIDELIEMYYSIGNGGPYGNIGEFNVYDTYWSSSEIDNNVWYVSFSIGSININNKDVTYSLRPIRAFGNWTMGCMDSPACNFNPDANMADGSCEYPLEEGLDCNGNPLINCYYPPDPEFVSWLQNNTDGVMNGDCLDIDAAGELEYIDSIMVNSIMTSNTIMSTNINNLNGIQYFTNLSSLYITNNQILEYIPDMSSLNLSLLYIGANHLLTNLPDFSGLDNLAHLDIDNNNGIISIPNLYYLNNLNFLRIAFNNTLTSLPDLSGLTNLSNLEIEDNYNLECVEGYPEHLTIQEEWPSLCEEEVTYHVGDLVEGGIVFYVDSTGQHGLVAAMEDLEGTYEWGCYGEIIEGADGIAIGYGYQNSLDIIAGCSQSPIAASEALAFEVEQYNDWYLPSFNELQELYHSIGNGGLMVVNFSNHFYWSSTSYSNNSGASLYAFHINLYDLSDTPNIHKYSQGKVRPIRSF